MSINAKNSRDRNLKQSHEICKINPTKTDASTRSKDEPKRPVNQSPKLMPRPTATSMARATNSLGTNMARNTGSMSPGNNTNRAGASMSPTNKMRSKSNSSPPSIRKSYLSPSTPTKPSMQQISSNKTMMRQSAPECPTSTTDDLAPCVNEPVGEKQSNSVEEQVPVSTDASVSQMLCQSISEVMMSVHTPDLSIINFDVTSTHGEAVMPEKQEEDSVLDETTRGKETPPLKDSDVIPLQELSEGEATPTENPCERDDTQTDNILQLSDEDLCPIQIRDLESNSMVAAEVIEHVNENSIDVPPSIAAGWDAEEVKKMIKETENTVDNFVIQPDDSYLTTLKFRLSEATACMADVCHQALFNREQVLEWTFHMMAEQEHVLDTNCIEMVDKFKREGNSLLEMLEEMKNKAEEDVQSALQLTSQNLDERSALELLAQNQSKKVATLLEEMENLKLELATALAQPQSPPPPPAPTNEEQEEVARQLKEERSTSSSLRERLSAAEAQLRSSKSRIAKLDRQLKETESSLSTLKETIKKGVEDQGRLREVQIDAKVRKARDAVKTSELHASRLAQQRDTLEQKVAELNEQLRVLSERHSSTTASLKAEIESLTKKLKQQKNSFEQESELRRLAEQALTSASKSIHDLRATITDLEARMPNPDAPTEREIAAWAETEAMREALRLAEEELATASSDKLHFLTTFANVDSENEVTVQQKLAMELQVKEELLCQMQNRIRELTKNCRLNEHKLHQYEAHLKDLQLYRAMVAGGGAAASSGVSSATPVEDNGAQDEPDLTRDPQREIINLRMSLVELVQQNEEMMEQLKIKESALEQQERTARTQKNVIKVREELINMMQKKEKEQNEELATMQNDLEQRMQIVDEVNKQIAGKAEEIQQLFTTLEGKQQEIQRREKVIRALEEQLRRAQAQRTRQEEKIAALEHELLESGARRRQHEKKFIFF